MTYSLPSISTVHGTFNVDIVAPDWGLTAPTVQTIKSMGTLRRAAAVTVGEQEIGTLTLSVSDDYSTHAEGFWFKLFSSSTYFTGILLDIEVRITLVEGATERYFFFGSPKVSQGDWNTHYKGATRIRECSFVLIESVSKIFECDVTDWVNEVAANAITTDVVPAVGDGIYKAMSVRGLFSAMLSASGLNPSYSRDDTTFVYGTQDLKFRDGATNFHLGQVYVSTEVALSGSAVAMEYFNSAVSGCLHDYYSTMKQLFGDLLKNFGIVIAFSYDLDTDRYIFELRQCWRAHTTTLSFSSREKVEGFVFASDLTLDAVKAEQLKNDAKLAWFSRKYTSLAKNTSAPPDYVDLDLQCVNVFNIVAESPESTGRMLYGKAAELETGGAAPVAINAGSYYSYFSQAYVDEDPVTADIELEIMVAGYYSNRLAYDWQKFTHTYGTITASEGGGGETFSVVDILKRQPINDGVSSKNYFANVTEIDVDRSEMNIQWIQEEV